MNIKECNTRCSWYIKDSQRIISISWDSPFDPGCIRWLPNVWSLLMQQIAGPKSFADDLWTGRRFVLRSLRSVETHPLTSRKFVLAFRTAYIRTYNIQYTVIEIVFRRRMWGYRAKTIESEEPRQFSSSSLSYSVPGETKLIGACCNLLINWLMWLIGWFDCCGLITGGRFDWCFIFICTARWFHRF